MKVIMVPVADRPECRLALEQAFGLSERLSANIVGYHLRPHRGDRHPSASGGERLSLLLEEAELPDLSEQDIELNRANAQKLFRAMAGHSGIAMASKPRAADKPLAFWNEMVGTPEYLFGIIGPTSDCIVVSRPRKKASGPARAFMLAALLNSGKPLLILPQHKIRSSGSRVLVAWDQSPNAAAALTAAIPLLGRAEQVHLVCCGPEELPGPKLSHVRNYLAHWGVEARTHRSRGQNPTRELLDAYREHQCDLLVMGAYSRSRLRERILGGVTHELLMEHDLPVFALHP